MNFPQGETVLSSIHDVFEHVLQIMLQESKDYGSCTENQKSEFIYGIHRFIKFLKSKLNLI